MPVHDLVFSLGPNCKNAWNTRSHFGVTFAYPFDWWITPAKAMLRMIEPDFRFQVSLADLAITPVAADGGNSVFNRRLNLLHHHDFPRQANLVQAVTAEQVAALNDKYAARFARLREDMRRATAPLALVNGINRGWRDSPAGAGQCDPALNGRMQPQDFVDAVRARLGTRLRVVIVMVGPEQLLPLDGGALVARPDDGQRMAKGSAPSYAEPVHAFRACYAALGLALGP